MDPLILAGEEIIPIIIENVKNPSMPRRLYAIGFLGNAKSDDALPILISFLNDESETESIRAHALRAIAMIDLQVGKNLAKPLEQMEGLLGSVAQDVMSENQLLLQRRTYSDAFFRRKY